MLRAAQVLLILEAGLLLLSGIVLVAIGVLLGGSASVSVGGGQIGGAAAAGLGTGYVAAAALIVLIAVLLRRGVRWAAPAGVAVQAGIVAVLVIAGEASLTFGIELAVCAATALALVLTMLSEGGAGT
ncbi:MAG: hypothetical protein JOY68_03125 [Candidatus Dormibacteraeota bacterium]|nr:hypothetical protein [Candidatus Dormibacteraeota bacterium]MBV8445135.1 hypothetical protein [Candidatus Dormibacteraeota bacterium]